MSGLLSPSVLLGKEADLGLSSEGMCERTEREDISKLLAWCLARTGAPRMAIIIIVPIMVIFCEMGM